MGDDVHVLGAVRAAVHAHGHEQVLGRPRQLQGPSGSQTGHRRALHPCPGMPCPRRGVPHALPWSPTHPHPVSHALTLGFCSHISSLCTAISRTSLYPQVDVSSRSRFRDTLSMGWRRLSWSRSMSSTYSSTLSARSSYLGQGRMEEDEEEGRPSPGAHPRLPATGHTHGGGGGLAGAYLGMSWPSCSGLSFSSAIRSSVWLSSSSVREG